MRPSASHTPFYTRLDGNASETIHIAFGAEAVFPPKNPLQRIPQMQILVVQIEYNKNVKELRPCFTALFIAGTTGNINVRTGVAKGPLKELIFKVV
jgi:hypothetical protein